MGRDRAASETHVKYLFVIALAACGAPPTPPSTPVAAPTSRDAAIDAPALGDDEKLAAIQKATNDLVPAVQGCWAAVAAAERFDVAGAIAAQIDIASPSHVTLVRDTANNATLSACITKVLEAYRWPPPLVGQSIQLPFEFHAPDGQSVVDRQLIPEHVQGKVAVSVLLDENTTGNPAASMLGVTIAAGASTGLRAADRDQIWYVSANEAKVGNATASPGDMIFVPKGSVFDVAAATGELHAVVVLVPGGREGIARAGALPNRESTAKPSGAMVLHAKDAKIWCRDGTKNPDCPSVQIFAEPSTIHASSLSASRLHIRDVPDHTHPHETELVYVESGHGVLTVGGIDLPISDTSVTQVPAGIHHSFRGEMNGFQVYTPAGPEQRFKNVPAPAPKTP
jgi:quercetin dioxygenase-like cupin family protein